MEIANAGSGFLQFLLLAAFLYVHENAVLLIDEPDSHMHVFLQRGMYYWLQEVARQNGSQLIISTHSEVLVNNAELEQIHTFFGDTPKRPSLKTGNIINALREVSPLDVINAEWKKRILFAEGDTDLRLLKAWAVALEHPVMKELEDINFQSLDTNDIGKAKRYYTALKDVVAVELKAFCLRDSDAPRTQDLPPGFEACYWGRQEIENYLIHPIVLLRFLKGRKIGGLFLKSAEDYLKDNLPPIVFRDPLNETISEKGSDFLKKFFSSIGFPISKGEYWGIAMVMGKEEISPDVKEVLDKIASFLKCP